MRKLLTLGLASLFVVVTGCQDTNTTGPLAGPSFHEGGDDDGAATAELETLNASGIEGEIEFTDDGSTLTIDGEAEGMDPNAPPRHVRFADLRQRLFCDRPGCVRTDNL